MSVFEVLSPTEPSAEQSAKRVKRTLAQAFQQLEASLTQVRRIVERHGRENILPALGDDRTEVVNLYRALRGVVEQHKPGAAVPDLPE